MATPWLELAWRRSRARPPHDAVSRDHICRRANLSIAKSSSEGGTFSFSSSARRANRVVGSNIAKRGNQGYGQFKTRSTAPFRAGDGILAAFYFLRLGAAIRHPTFKIGDFLDHSRISGDGVVIGKSDKGKVFLAAFLEYRVD